MTLDQMQELQIQIEQSLENWEETLWIFDAAIEENGVTPNAYSDKSLACACKIFSHVVMNKMYFTPEGEREGIDKMELADSFGKELREVIKKYTLKDSHDFYK